MGEQLFRRPGDPSLDELIQKHNSEKDKADNASQEEVDGNSKTELQLNGTGIFLQTLR